MTVGTVDEGFGYSSGAIAPRHGVLVEPDISHSDESYTVRELVIFGEVVVIDLDRFLPRGTIFNLGGAEFTADEGSELADTQGRYTSSVASDFGWLLGQKVTVSARVAPVFVSATIRGESLVLTYSEPLDAGSVPSANTFAVRVSNRSSNENVVDVAIDSSTVTLTLQDSVPIGAALTVSYTVPAGFGAKQLQDETGVVAAALTSEPVTNITTFWSANLTVGVDSQGSRGFVQDTANDFGMVDDSNFLHSSRTINVQELTADDSTTGAVTFDLTYIGTALDLSGLTLEFAGEVLPLADATVSGSGRIFKWTQTWVAANAPSLAAANYAATLPDGAEVLACLRGGGDQMCPRETSTDATLSGLALENAADATAIALTPAFAFDTTSYTASVANGVTEITVRPTTGDTYASVEYLDASDMAIPDANRSRIGRQVPLSVGQNTIKVKVTAEDDSTVETYTVVVRRAAPTVAALVSNTGQTPATAVEAGASGASRFSVAQSFETGDAGRYALSSVQLHISDFGGSDSADDVTVTIAANGAGNLPGDTLYTLSAESISDGALNTFAAPANAALDGTQTTYWVVVEGGSSLFKVGTASSDALDAGTAAGWDIADGRVGRSSDGGSWSAADAELRIAVSGYAVAAMASTDAALSGLVLNSTDLTPEFDPAVTEYRGWSDDSDGMITVRPTRRDGGATVEVLDGDDMPLPDANGGANGHQVQLEVGVNTLKFRVTAEDRVTTRTYTVSVVLEADDPDPLDADAVWHANLTVETGESGGTALAGYNTSAGRGAMASNRFRVDSKSIVVRAVEHGGGTLRFRYATLSAGGTLAGGAYVLEVDGHRFNLPDPGPAGDHEFTDPGFSWSRGDVVTVKLLRAEDATAPALERATVSGTSLALVYDDTLDESSVPAASAFSVKVDGGAGAEPDSVSVSGRVALLTLATAATAAQSVTVSYAKPASSPLRNEAGVDAPALTDRAVTNDTGATPVAVIEAVTESAIFRRDAATFRVSRGSGSLAEALTVDIALSQDRSFLAAGSLAKTVTIPANATGALLTLGPGEFRAFPTGSRIASGGLTATVLDGADYDVGADASAEVDIRIALTIGPEMSAYTVDEGAGTLPVRWIARTGERAGLLHESATFLSLSSVTVSAGAPGDYSAVSSMLAFSREGYAKAGTVYENVQTVPFTIVDDTDAEQTEFFEMELQMSPGLRTWLHNFVDGDGNACGSSCRYRVAITDNDPADGLSALVLEDADDDTAIALSPAFAADVTAYTAAVADTVTRVTVEPTLAAEGSTISYRDANNAVIDDADDVANGMQVDLAAGETVIRVRLSRDAPGFGTHTNVQIYTITVTRVAPVVPGAPKIQGVPQAGQTLTAVQGTIDDEHGLPATAFPLGYTFQWVLVDGGTETDISGETSDTYTLTGAEAGKKVKVEVSFTDGASNPETRESAESGTVVAMQEDCAADRPNADWCATMTVGRDRFYRGYDEEDIFGSLTEPTIEYGGTTYTVEKVRQDPGEGVFEIGLDRFLLTDAKVDVGGAAFDIDTSYEAQKEGQYSWGRDPLPDWIAGQKVTVSANLAPLFIDATVDGASLVLTYVEDLDADSVPAVDAFAVTVAGGTPAAPTGVAVSGAAVTLTLASAVTHGQAVTVSYTPPASNPLQDASGLGVLALTDEPVANRAADSTGSQPATGAPVLFVEGHSGAPRVGDTLVADLSAIRDGDGLATAAFTFEWVRARNGADTTITGADAGEYLLSPADEGAAVRLEVSFTDDGGKAEGPLASAPTAAVAGRPGGSCTSDTVRLVGGDDGSEGSVQYCRSNQYRNVCDDEWDKVDADVACRMAGYPDGALKGTIGSYFVNFLTVSYWLDDVACTGNESSLAGCGHAGWGRSDCSYIERAGVMCDIGAPAAVSAAVDGATLAIVFDEDLAAAPNLSNEAFTVYKTPDGGSSQEVALSGPPTIDGATVTLRLATGVVESDRSVRVEYEKPETGGLMDGDGVEVESFERGARNATGVMPVAISAVVDGATLEIAFSKELAAAPDLANSSFTVKKTPSGGSERTESLSGAPSIDGATVTLTLAAPALSSDTDVTVSYTKPASGTGNALEDPSGREVGSFTGLAVINNSNVAATGAPAVTGLLQVGGTLTAALGTIADEDGLPARFPDFYDLQWVRVAGGTETDIAGATGTGYEVTADDDGSVLKVRITFKDGAGGTEILESAPTAPVIAAAEDCTDDRPHADWCATMTVGALDRGALGTLYGFNFVDSVGSLVDPDTNVDLDQFTYGTILYTIDELALLDGASGDDSVRVEMGEFLPRGSLFNFGGMEFTADASSEQATAGEYEWDVAADFGWRAEGQEVTVSVNRPPGGETAAVNGASLVLTYGEDLDTDSVPAEAAFAVTVDGGAPAAPSDVAVSGNTVTLTLASAVTPGQEVKLTYTVPGSDAVQDESGLEAGGLVNRAVDNETPDARLIALVIENADNDTAIAISPAFDAATADYTASVANAVDEITVRPTLGDSNASFEYLDASDMAIADTDSVKGGHQVPLPVGVSTIKVKVTAADNATTGTYTLVVRRPLDTSMANQIWTSDLATADLTPGTGCDNALNNTQKCSAQLDDDDFDYGDPAIEYAFTRIVFNSGRLDIEWDPDLPAAVEDLVLKVSDTGGNSEYFDFANADHKSDGRRYWDGLGSVDGELDQTLTLFLRSPDGTAPAFSSAAVKGALLTITFDEDLAAAANLANSAFTVKKTPQAGSEETVGLTGSPSISGATVTLTLAAAPVSTDTGVKVSYARPATGADNKLKDAAGNEVASFTDEPVTVDASATGAPGISGTPQAGQRLTATIGDIADIDGLPGAFPGDYEFQWVRVADDAMETVIADATSSTYDPVAADVGSALKVRVSFTDGGGTDEGPLESALTGTVVAMQEDCAADRLTANWCTTMTVERWVVGGGFDGYGFEGSASHGTLDDPTIDHGVTTYTLDRVQLNISTVNPTSSTVAVQFANVGFVPRGSLFDLGGVEFTADGDSEEGTRSYEWDLPTGMAWLDGQKVTVSANLVPALDSATVDGTSLVLTYAEDLDIHSVPAASAYEVTVDGGAAAEPTGVAVSGNTVTLTLASAVTVGQTVTVSYTKPPSSPLQDASGLDAPAFTDREATVGGKPEISGTAQQGKTLTVDTSRIRDPDGLTGVSYSYRWMRVDRDGSSNATDVGTDSSTYTLTSADIGKRLKVEVTFDDDANNPEERTSDAGSVVAPAADLSTCPGDETDVWCATLTSERVDGSHAGFNAEDSLGGLDPLEFQLGGVTYEVTGVAAGRIASGLTLATTPNLPAGGGGLTLHVQTFGGEHGVALSAGQFASDTERWNLAYPGTYQDVLHDGPLSDVVLLRGRDERPAFILEATDDGTEIAVRLSRPANSAATGKPAVSGTAVAGRRLTADISGIADGNGLPGGAEDFSYR